MKPLVDGELWVRVIYDVRVLVSSFFPISLFPLVHFYVPPAHSSFEQWLIYMFHLLLSFFGHGCFLFRFFCLLVLYR